MIRPAPFDPAAGPPLLDEHGRLASDVCCTKCGYNLRGLVEDGTCPECGASIVDAVREFDENSPHKRWTRRLVRGTTLLLIAGAIGGLYWVATRLISHSSTLAQALYSNQLSRIAWMLAGYVSQAVACLAYFYVTTPEQLADGTLRPAPMRLVARWGLLVIVASAVLSEAVSSTGLAFQIILGVFAAQSLISAVFMFALCQYAASLARRLSGFGVALQIHTFQVLAVTTSVTVGTCNLVHAAGGMVAMTQANWTVLISRLAVRYVGPAIDVWALVLVFLCRRKLKRLAGRRW